MIADLKPYPEYKESGLPWLGPIPKHWSRERAKWLFTKMERPVGDDDGVVTCFRDGMVTLRKNRRLRGFTEAIYEFGYQGILKGDLVIHAMDAFAGAVGVSDSDGKATPVYAVCQPKPNVNAHYYAFIVREMARSQWILALSRGIRERSTDFRYDTFGGQRVPLPPPAEQATIVRFLNWANGRLERAVQAKRKVIALLNEQKQAVIHHAVTGGLDPSVPLKPSGIPWLGEIPAHWEVLPLRGLLAERKEKNDPIKTNNILSLSLHAGVIPYADKRPGGNKAKEDLSAYMLAYPGDIVLNSMNVVVGSVGLSKYFGAVSPVYYMLHPRHADDLVEFFDAIFQASAFQRSLFGLGNGIMVIQSKSSGKLNTIRLRIPMTKLRRVQLPYPEPKEQAAIVEHIAQAKSYFDNAINTSLRELELLREYRARLVADVVTGKLDVREAATRVPDEVCQDTPKNTADLSDEIESADEEEAAV